MIRKVCGITERTNVEKLLALSVDWIGFIFVASSKRNNLNKPVISTPENGPKRIGVFKDSSREFILTVVKEWRLDGVQLHGRESANLCRSLREEGLLIIKAFGMDQSFEMESITPYIQTVHYFLFDTPGGGTGKSFDWSQLAAYHGPTPFLLAGGIGPNSLDELGAFNHDCWSGIDLNSKFETEPGRKDTDLLDKFLAHEL